MFNPRGSVTASPCLIQPSMGLFREISTIDSLLIIFGMWASFSLTGSLVFLALGTPWEFKDEWYYVLLRGILRILVGFFTGLLITYFHVNFY
jgi:hypothetical protein